MNLKIILLLLVFLLPSKSNSVEIKNNTATNYCFEQIEIEKLLSIEYINIEMLKESNKELCLLYLRKYADKDINGVAEMFSEDIVLRDWKIYVTGKENALMETRKNFKSADSIEIEVLSTYEDKSTVAAELKITVDSAEILYVVDVITFNSDSKIKSIRAYLGRGDN